jgi:hypothetical protein
MPPRTATVDTPRPPPLARLPQRACLTIAQRRTSTFTRPEVLRAITERLPSGATVRTAEDATDAFPVVTFWAVSRRRAKTRVPSRGRNASWRRHLLVITRTPITTAAANTAPPPAAIRASIASVLLRGDRLQGRSDPATGGPRSLQSIE